MYVTINRVKFKLNFLKCRRSMLNIIDVIIDSEKIADAITLF